MHADRERASGALARPPWQAITITVVLVLEALALVGVGVWLAVEAFGETGMHIVGTVFLAVMAVGCAAWLLAIARAVLRGKRWTRAATLVWQIIQIAVAAGSVGGEASRPDIAAVLAIPALVAGVLVLGRTMSIWFELHDESAGEHAA